MIADQDRSGWFGASDTDYVIGNYDTKSFEKWWQQKEGFYSVSSITTDAMLAGTNYEHEIADFIDEYLEKDKQILLPELRLRVNLDANTEDTIIEIKTYKLERGFKVPIKYKRQVWVQMYAANFRKAKIAAYGLTEKEYDNYFIPIEKSRLSFYDIEPNDDFINNTYLPHLKFLVYCLDNGIFPTNERWTAWSSRAE